MSKDFADLSPKAEREIRNLANMPDSDVNTDDIPEITNWEEASRVLFRPVKQQITLRLDADAVQWFNAHAQDVRSFQTDINGALRDHVYRYEKKTASGRSK